MEPRAEGSGLRSTMPAAPYMSAMLSSRSDAEELLRRRPEPDAPGPEALPPEVVAVRARVPRRPRRLPLGRDQPFSSCLPTMRLRDSAVGRADDAHE